MENAGKEPQVNTEDGHKLVRYFLSKSQICLDEHDVG